MKVVLSIAGSNLHGTGYSFSSAITANLALELEIIQPDAHYDGLDELLKGNIHFATNEPLHLITTPVSNPVTDTIGFEIIRRYFAKHAGFANFSALDIFVNQSFYQSNTKVCEDFNKAVKSSIKFIQDNPKKALEHYYVYIGEESSKLMDDIINATVKCFDKDYTSIYAKALPILKFFTEIGITSLDEKLFKTVFLH